MSPTFLTRDLTPMACATLMAIIVLAVFAWTERTVVVAPACLSVSCWPWKLWQIAPLLISLGGVWWIWLGSAREAWLRCLALALLVLSVFVNAYTGGFGEHSGNVWRTVNPLFIACSSVAAVNLWRLGGLTGRAGTAVSAGLGGIVFANAYFVDNGVIWQILNPLMMLAILAWAAGAGRVNVATDGHSEPD